MLVPSIATNQYGEQENVCIINSVGFQRQNTFRLARVAVRGEGRAVFRAKKVQKGLFLLQIC